MNRSVQHRLTLTLSILLFCSIGFVTSAQPRVVIKFDDLSVIKGKCKMLPVMQYLIQRQTKASYGVIASKLDETAAEVLGPILDAKNKAGNPLVEIWHHGLTHTRDSVSSEFKNKPYAYQKQHFDAADTLVKKYLGIQMQTFGAPFNATDSVCLRVISENSAYKKIFFSKVNVHFNTPLIRLNNNGRMERKTGVPDFNTFKEQIDKHPEYLQEYIVLQGHPNLWTEEGFEEFKKILSYLDGLHCEYVLPVEL